MTPEQVEQVLEEAVKAASSRGIRIDTQWGMSKDMGEFKLLSFGDHYKCCPITAILITRPQMARMNLTIVDTAAVVLGITAREVLDIVSGFDWEFPTAQQLRRPFVVVGNRLRKYISNPPETKPQEEKFDIMP